MANIRAISLNRRTTGRAPVSVPIRAHDATLTVVFDERQLMDAQGFPVETILAGIKASADLYHRLILVAGLSGSGKTATLRAVATHTGVRMVNLSLELSHRLLDLTVRRRVLELPCALDEILGRDAPLVLLDNTEILFDPAFRQDPLRLLQHASRNRTIVASWNGTVDDRYLSYADPGHPEHRRYPTDGLVIVVPSAVT